MIALIPHSRSTLGAAERDALFRVLRSGHLGRGPEVAAFEDELAAALHQRRVLAVQSGTQALFLALRALEVGARDEVILPSSLCTAVLNAVLQAGARAVVVDNTGPGATLSAADVDTVLSRRTKAIIAAHMLGAPADIRALRRFAVPVIEDCAMALGAEIEGVPLGGLGDLAIGSLYATKYLTSAHGGFVATSRKAWADGLSDLVDFDNRADYKVRYNARLSDLQAALGRVQLQRLDAMHRRRRALAARYLRAFDGLDLDLPHDSPQWPHAYFRFCLGLSPRRRAALQKTLAAAGIEAKRPVFKPLHRYLGLAPQAFPAAEAAWQRWLSIPCYPALTRAQQRRVIDAVRGFARR